MTRPHKKRCITSQPTACVYKPAGVPVRNLQWVVLTLDEYETIRLIDHEGMDQTAAAELMGISRPTVTRIYASARQKLGSAIVLGQAIKIEGGPVVQGESGGGFAGPMGMGGGRGRGRGRGGRGRGNGFGRGRRFFGQMENMENENENSNSSSRGEEGSES